MIAEKLFIYLLTVAHVSVVSAAVFGLQAVGGAGAFVAAVPRLSAALWRAQPEIDLNHRRGFPQTKAKSKTQGQNH